MADITIVFMGSINQLITGGHHPVRKDPPFYSWENQRTKWPCSIAMLVYQRVLLVDAIDAHDNGGKGL